MARKKEVIKEIIEEPIAETTVETTNDTQNTQEEVVEQNDAVEEKKDDIQEEVVEEVKEEQTEADEIEKNELDTNETIEETLVDTKEEDVKVADEVDEQKQETIDDIVKNAQTPREKMLADAYVKAVKDLQKANTEKIVDEFLKDYQFTSKSAMKMCRKEIVDRYNESGFDMKSFMDETIKEDPECVLTDDPRFKNKPIKYTESRDDNVPTEDKQKKSSYWN